jgi:hypothetical protein
LDFEQTGTLLQTTEGLAKASVSGWIFCPVEMYLLIRTRVFNILHAEWGGKPQVIESGKAKSVAT